jgi:hypothetical protein
MSFAIEVAGEAAPLNQWELVKALASAGTSTDHSQRQSASQQLQTWESHPDYYTHLQVTLRSSLLGDGESRFLLKGSFADSSGPSPSIDNLPRHNP